MRHRDGLECGGAEKHPGDHDKQGCPFTDGQRLAALQPPAARAERECCPLKRQMGKVRDERWAIGTERATNRQHVHHEPCAHSDVCDPSRELMPMCSHHTQQQRPRSNRQVMGKEREHMSRAWRRIALRAQAEPERAAHRTLQPRALDSDDGGRAERHDPGRGIRCQPRTAKLIQPPAAGASRPSDRYVCGSHDSTT